MKKLNRGTRQPRFRNHRSFHVETLEERRLLTADPATVPVEFSVLEFQAVGNDALTEPVLISDNLSEPFIRGGVDFQNRSLWRADRDTLEISKVADIPNIGKPYEFGDSLVTFTSNELIAIPKDGAGGVTTVLSTGQGWSITPTEDGNEFYFISNAEFGDELWKSDGTEDSAIRVTDLASGIADGVHSDRLAYFNGDVYFAGTNGSSGIGLWKYNEILARTTLVTEKTYPYNYDPVTFDGKLIFLGNQFTTSGRFIGGGLWRSDGTDVGTELIHGHVPRESTVRQFFLHEGEVYFTVDADRNEHYQLYRLSDAFADPKLVFDATALHQSLDPAATDIVRYDQPIPFKDGFLVWEEVRDGTVGSGPEHDRLVFYPSEDEEPRVLADTGIRGFWDRFHRSDISVIGDQIVFAIQTESATTFWASDGEEDGLREISSQSLDGPVGFQTYVDGQDKLFVIADQARTLTTVVAHPTAYAGPDESINEGASFVLDASNSRDLENAIVSYEWDLDYDGSSFDVDATGLTTSINADDGPSATTIGLRVTDRWGHVSLADKSFTVENVPPSIEGLSDISTVLGGQVTLTAEVADPGVNDTVATHWDLGDGTTVSDVTELTHVYAAEGEYFARLTATDSDGAATVRDFRVVVGPAIELAESAVELPEEFSGPSEIQVRFVEDLVLSEDVVVPVTFSGSASRNDFLIFQDSALTVTHTTDTVTIPAGQRFGKIYLRPVDDPTDEEDETLVMQLGIPSNASLGGAVENSWTLIDNDPEPDVFLASGSRVVSEDAGAIPVIARLSQVSEKDVTVALAYSGSATNGEDFASPATEIVIPAGQIEVGTPIRLVDDNLGESVEQILVSISSAINASPTGNTETHLINANDAPTIQFASVLKNVSETSGEHRVTVKLSNPSDAVVSAQIGYTGSAVVGQDYSVVNTDPFAVSFAPGETSQELIFAIVNDEDIEEDESINLSLFSIEGALEGSTLTHQSLVVDDDNLRVAVTVSENEIWEDSNEFFIEATLSKPTAVPVEIPISITGTLQQGDDYLLGADTILIPAGAPSGIVAVLLRNDDELPESDERIVITASEPQNAGLDGPGSIGVTIKDNDPYVRFETSTRSTNLAEGDKSIVRLTASDVNGNSIAVNRDIDVYLDVVSSQTDRDDTSVPGVVTIPAGESFADFEVVARDDGTFEDTETFRVKITSVENGVEHPDGRYRSRVFSIRDDDSPPRTYWEFPGGVFREGSSFLIPFTARLSRVAETRVHASLTFSGSATKNEDYHLLGPPTVTFEPGELRTTVLVGIRDDGAYEGLETIDLHLATDGNRPATYSLPLNDNETKPRKKEKRKWWEKAGDYLQDNVVEPSGLGDLLGTLNAKHLFPAGFSVESELNAIADGLVTLFTEGGGSEAEFCVEGLVDIPTFFWGPYRPEICITDEQIQDVVDYVSTFLIGTPPEGIKVQHGYIQEATVFIDENFDELLGFIDANGNGIQDLGERNEREVTTDYAGSAHLGLPLSLDRDQNGSFETDEFQYVSLGGVDISTDYTINVPLAAPFGYSIISPLTTLVAKLRQLNGDDVNAAEERVVAALGLPSTEFLNADLISIADAGSKLAAEAFSKSTQVFSTALQVASFGAGLANSVGIPLNGSLVTSDMAEKILAEDSRLDLTNEFVTEAILRGVISRAGATLPANDVLSAAASVIANSNRALGQAIGQTGREYVEEIVRVQKVTEGSAAQQLLDLAVGAITPSDISQAYTIDAIETQAATEEIGNVVIPGIIADDVTITEGDDGSTIATFEVGLTNASNLPVSVDFTTSDVTALAGEDYTATSGQLTWPPGDTSTRQVQVAVLGDTDAESDERFHLLLTNPVNAAVLGTIAFGDIVSDDGRNLTPSDTTIDHGLLLDVADGVTRLFDNGSVAFEGALTGNAAFTIEAVPNVRTDLTAVIRPDVDAHVDGFEFLGSGANSSLLIDASFATSIEHIYLGNDDGLFLVDGVAIAYQNVETVHSLASPTISGMESGEIVIGDSISFVGQPPAAFDTSLASTAAWSLYIDGVEESTIDDSELEFSAVRAGTYKATYRAIQEGRIDAVASYEFEVSAFPPSATILSADTGDEGAVIEFDAIANDTDGAVEDLSYVWNFGDGVPLGETEVLTDSSFDGLATAAYSLGNDRDIAQGFTIENNGMLERMDLQFQFNPGTTGSVLVQLTRIGETGFPDRSQVLVSKSIDVATLNRNDWSSIDGLSVPVQQGDELAILVRKELPGTSIAIRGAGGNAYEDGQGFSKRDIDPEWVTISSDIVFQTFVMSSPIVESYGKTVDHTYTDDGEYEVTLTVTDQAGLSATTSKLVLVKNVAPTATIDEISANRVEGTPIEIFASATDPAGASDILEFEYQVHKDGLPFAAGEGINMESFSFTPDDNGSYEITLVVSDEDGGRSGEVQDVVLTTAELGETGGTVPGVSLNGIQLVGAKFEVTESLDVTEIGGHILTYSGTGPFAALVKLNSSTDFPDSFDLTTPDVIATTVLQNAIGASADVSSPIAATLAPGWYAVVMGSELFGATGNSVAAKNNTPNGSSSFFSKVNAQPYLDDPSVSGVRFYIGGTLADSTKETIHVTNASPNAVPDAATILENSPAIKLNVVSNDTDPAEANDPLSLQSIDITQTLGQVQIEAGEVTYDPAGRFEHLADGETQIDTFVYRVEDDDGGASHATVTITVSGENDAPVAVDDAYVVSEENLLSPASTVGLLVNDLDADGDSLKITRINGTPFLEGITLVSGATIEPAFEDNRFVYNPLSAFDYLAFGETGSDSFTYEIVDEQGETATADVNITVNGWNDSPNAIPDSYVVSEDSLLVPNAGILDNDADAEGEVLSLVSLNGQPVDSEITLASGATIEVYANGSFTYDPRNAFNSLPFGQSATEQFTYTVADESGGTDLSTVTITIAGSNDPAEISGDMVFNIGEDQIGMSGALQVVDLDDSEASFATQVNNGTTFGAFSIDGDGSWNYSLDNQSVQYLDDGFFLEDSIQVSTIDGSAATLTFVIIGGDDSDIDGVDDDIEDGAGDGNGDGVPDSQQDHVASLPNAVSGTYITVETNTVQLTSVSSAAYPVGGALPPEDVLFPIGFTQFTADLADGVDEATITIFFDESVAFNSIYKFGPTQDEPEPHYYEFNYDSTTGLGTEFFADRIVIHLLDGELGDFDGTVNGQITDPIALALSPRIGDDYVELMEDQAATLAPLENDVWAGTLSVVSVGTPSHGTVTLNDDDTLTYMPDENYFGDDNFDYSVTDSSGTLVGSATVRLTINGTNDAPSIGVNSNAPVIVDEGQPAAQAGTWNDIDPMDTVSLSANHGTVTLRDDGTWTWAFETANGPSQSEVIVTARDSAGATASVSFELLVENVPPKINTLQSSATFSNPAERDGSLVLTNIGQETAAYRNSYGYYHFDQRGKPTTGRIVWANMKDNVGNRSVLNGIDPASVEFFLVPDGQTLNADLVDDTEVTFQQDADGDWFAQTLDGQSIVGRGAQAFFSNCRLNSDRRNHVTDNSTDGNQNWEDLVGQGDRDFDDVNVDVVQSAVVTLSGTFQDPGGVDEHSLAIQWDDGNTTIILPDDPRIDRSAGTFEVSHHYVTGGVFSINVIIDDGDGGLANRVTTGIVSGVRLTQDGELQVVGSSESDRVELSPANNKRAVEVRSKLGSESWVSSLYDMADVSGSLIYLLDGDDRLDISHHSAFASMNSTIHGGEGVDRIVGGRASDEIYGGPGDDRIWGQDGNDYLSGGDGDDRIYGGRGDDILLGGSGRDRLWGNRGRDVMLGGLGGDDLQGGRNQDILLAGVMQVDPDQLFGVRDVWSSDSSYEARVNLLSSVGGLLQPLVQVSADEHVDSLRGDNGRDFFFANLSGDEKDLVRDLSEGELAEDVFEMDALG